MYIDRIYRSTLIPFLFAGMISAIDPCTHAQTFATREFHVASDRELAAEMEYYLRENLLQVWYPRIMDRKDGGFLTNFSFDWKPLPPHPKMIVSQARDVWTACKAAERYPADPRYREAADHGFQFLKDHMWDHKNGGFYFYLSITGSNTGTGFLYKKAYGQAFAIYALAAYVKLTGSKKALELAQKAFHWFDKHSHDPVYGGYFDWMTLDGISYADDRYRRDLFPATAGNVEWKDFNSSIHIMEAFAELYGVWPDSLLRKRLEEMHTIIRDTMTTERGYLRLYFRSDWSVVSYRDSSQTLLSEHIEYDHVSFGHDIETAYLLLETSHALGHGTDERTRQVSKKLIDHTIAHGFDLDYAGIYDAGYYDDSDGSITILKETKNWWSQAEGLNALLLFSGIYPDEKTYKKAFIKLWQYVKQSFIDHEHGGWYARGLDKEPEKKHVHKAHAWKSCYHNGRALMNCVDMLLNAN